MSAPLASSSSSSSSSTVAPRYVTTKELRRMQNFLAATSLLGIQNSGNTYSTVELEKRMHEVYHDFAKRVNNAMSLVNCLKIYFRIVNSIMNFRIKSICV